MCGKTLNELALLTLNLSNEEKQLQDSNKGKKTSKLDETKNAKKAAKQLFKKLKKKRSSKKEN